MGSENPGFVRLGVTIAAVVAGVTPIAAFAADLPQPMYTKAPPAIAGAPPYLWSGFYIGGHFGYLWGRARVEDDGVTTESNARTDGIIGGAMLGYNWQIDHVVFGLEGDIGWSNAHGVGAGRGVLVAVTTHAPNSYDIHWTSRIRGRIGHVFGDWLVFAAGGFAAADLSFREGATSTTNVLAEEVGGTNTGGAITGGTIVSDGGKYYGWSVGGGVEHAFTTNLVGRVEYFYDNYGHKDYVGALGDHYRVSLTGQTARAALAWKFGP